MCAAGVNDLNGEINDSPKQVKISKQETIDHRKAQIRATVDRLSKPRNYNTRVIVVQHCPNEKRTTDERSQIFERLCRSKHKIHTKISQENGCSPITVNRSFQEISEISNRLNKEIRRKETPRINRGPTKSLHELDNFVSRMSTPKTLKERKIHRKVEIEKHSLSRQDINKLCLKLSNPEYCRQRTPETKRLLDKRFSPVNTYAWHGLGYKVPQYLATEIVQ